MGSELGKGRGGEECSRVGTMFRGRRQQVSGEIGADSHMQWAGRG